MIFNIKEENGKMLAEVTGRLDTAAAVHAATEIQPLIDNAEKEIVLDCKGLEYISSSGLRLILTIRKASSQKNGRVAIRNINETIRQVFTMTGFMSLFDVE